MYIQPVERALALIKQHGIYGLGNPDGCACTHFSICGYQIDVSCHKSEHCIRVHGEWIPKDLEVIAAEVLGQLAKYYDGNRVFWREHPYRVRFCEYKYDHFNCAWVDKVWVDHYSCCYCGKERADREAYLCGECSQKEQAKASFPWVSDGFLILAGSADGPNQGGPRA